MQLADENRMLQRLRRAKNLLLICYQYDLFPSDPLACVLFDCQSFWYSVAPFIYHSFYSVTRCGAFLVQFCSACMGVPIMNRYVVENEDDDNDYHDDTNNDDKEDDNGDISDLGGTFCDILNFH